ncbi:hypothetical protein LI012_16375 [Caldibacillus thermoamylovorans]|uniref:hypothetical protein n=1 Tax=Caldibacillus thermoamylovorans TaxID=35841 RepID=UPI001D09254C|nr:hypothetical protein [Caldibacillus thermoamylovorans]MCB5936529.1 hypothetical protein [Bacillus sp. DFI.2.34]MCB7078365.1 hypothetical protein [Caldibacillus thermoamylovorans]
MTSPSLSHRQFKVGNAHFWRRGPISSSFLHGPPFFDDEACSRHRFEAGNAQF